MNINDLEQFSAAFTAVLEKAPPRPEMIKCGRALLSELVLNPDWFRPTLSRLVLDEEFLKAQWQSIDANEILLYRSRDRLFSIRAYIWEPGVVYPIHDHGAWGLVGAHINRITERKFARTDDGSDENFSALRLTCENTLSPGETTAVLPLDDGIHQMHAPDGLTAVSIHVYGPPVRKGYIRFFDYQGKSVQRAYTPAMAKKVFAIRALGSIPDVWARDVLNEAVNSRQPEYILEECQSALSNPATSR